MRRFAAFLVASLTLLGGDVAAQVSDQTLVPKGSLRLQFNPSFTSWNSRFGERIEGGSIVRQEETLGSDLTDEVGTSLFPGVERLEDQIRSLTGNGGYSGVIGATSGIVSQDVTRIDLGGHIGVFDWLTVGVVVPWVKSHGAVDVVIRQDSASADLGLNPTISQATAVTDFLDALSTASSAALARAEGLCGADPGGAACTDALALSDRVGAFQASTSAAYFASAFFPMAGSAAAASLAGATGDLDADLLAAGLAGLGPGMTFATEWLTDEALASPGVIEGSAQGVNAPWAVGDIEASALVRLFDGEVRDSGAVAPSLKYSLTAGFLVRLGTGRVDLHDVAYDVATGDGQMDFEAQLIGFLGRGGRLGLYASGRYGIQQGTSLLRRVAVRELPLPPASTLRAVRWTPASYIDLNLEPVWRLSSELALVGSYRFYTKGADDYEILGVDPDGSVPVDIDDLVTESGVTVHQAGIGLRYTTVEPWRAGEASRPLELHARLVSSIAGSGGHTPVATRAELGIRIFRGIWGGN